LIAFLPNLSRKVLNNSICAGISTLGIRIASIALINAPMLARSLSINGVSQLLILTAFSALPKLVVLKVVVTSSLAAAF